MAKPVRSTTKDSLADAISRGAMVDAGAHVRRWRWMGSTERLIELRKADPIGYSRSVPASMKLAIAMYERDKREAAAAGVDVSEPEEA